jgi:hypothetical protein
LVVLVIEPRASCMLGKHPTAELHPLPETLYFRISFWIWLELTLLACILICVNYIISCTFSGEKCIPLPCVWWMSQSWNSRIDLFGILIAWQYSILWKDLYPIKEYDRPQMQGGLGLLHLFSNCLSPYYSSPVSFCHFHFNSNKLFLERQHWMVVKDMKGYWNRLGSSASSAIYYLCDLWQLKFSVF